MYNYSNRTIIIHPILFERRQDGVIKENQFQKNTIGNVTSTVVIKIVSNNMCTFAQATFFFVWFRFQIIRKDLIFGCHWQRGYPGQIQQFVGI